MNSDRWAELEPLLDQALELHPEALGPFLDEVRLSHPSLIDDLVGLLAAERGPRAAWADRAPPVVIPTSTSGLIGQTIGNYTVEASIGRGGMGSVWLASRSDGRYQAKVAVKLLNLALVGRAGEERFHQEGNVLARLTHPNIARLLDAGVTGAGQPYLVLEYVEGEPIDVFANRRELGTAARIELTLAVIEAVAAAHANLIVHRDLKPSNIMVTGDGTVKLLDFGISKMLQDGRPTEPTFTEGGAMTPEYAAPELVLGERVSTATDVYSLGVLLYQLLSGRHPTSEGLTGIGDHLRAVVEVEPKRLSEAPASIRRIPRGDLDLILAKALKKAPAERYQTVADLGADLRAFLTFRPIAARPDAWGYRARRFIRRNRGALIAATIVAGALVASTVVSLRQVALAEKQRDLARQSARRSAASISFESLLFRAMDGNEDRSFTYNELYQRARELVEKEYQHDRIAQLQLLAQFGQHYLRRGDLKNATEVLTLAVAVADSVGGAEWRGRSRCNLSLPLSKANRGDTAMVLVRAGQQLLAGVEDVSEGTRTACNDAEGDAYMVLSKPDSAGLAFQRTLDHRLSEGDTTTGDFVISLSNRARAASGAYDVRASLSSLNRILAMAKRGQVGDPSAVSIAVKNMSITLERAGEYRTNLDFLRREMRELAGGVAIDTLSTLLLNAYGTAFAHLQQGDSARLWLERSLRDGSNGPSYEVVARIALATMARSAGDTGAMQHQLQEVVRTRSGSRTGRFPVALFELTGASGTREEVTALVQRELDSITYGKGPVKPMIGHLTAAANALRRVGDFAGAKRYAAAAVEAGQLDALALLQNGRLGAAYVAQAEVQLSQGDSAAARASLKLALAPLRYGYGENHPLTVAAVERLERVQR